MTTAGRSASAGTAPPQRAPRAVPRPDLRVVSGRRRRRRRVVLLSALLTIVVFGMGLVLVAVQMQLMGSQERIDDLDRDIAVARDWNQRAKLRIDELSSPEAIVEGALALGMVEPESPVYLVPDPRVEREVLEATATAFGGSGR